MKPNIGIDDKNRKAIAKILNTLLADEYVLYTKTRNFHWNVVSPSFSELHKFFEAQYEELNDVIDDVAERVRQVGENSVATLKEFTSLARLKEQPGKYPQDDQMIKALLSDHEAVIRTLREDLEAAQKDHGDMGTSDFLTGLMEQHEKMAWMLRSFSK